MRLLVIAASGAALGASCASAVAASWSQPAAIALARSSNDRLAFDASVRPDGSALIALMRESELDWAERGVADTQWTVPQPIPDSCRCDTRVVTDANGQDVLLASPLGSGPLIAWSRSQGTDWSGRREINVPGGSGFELNHLTTTAGDVIADGTTSGTFRPYVIQRDGQSGSWRPSRLPARGSSYATVVRVGRNGRAVAVWEVTKSTRRSSWEQGTVWAATKAGPGAPWGPAHQLSNLSDPTGKKRPVTKYTGLRVQIIGLDATISDDGTITVGWGRWYRYSRYVSTNRYVNTSTTTVETRRLAPRSSRWSGIRIIDSPRQYRGGRPPVVLEGLISPSGEGALALLSDRSRGLWSTYSATGPLRWGTRRAVAATRTQGEVAMTTGAGGSVVAGWTGNKLRIGTAMLSSPGASWQRMGDVPSSGPEQNEFKLLPATPSSNVSVVWNQFKGPAGVFESRLQP